MSRFNQKTILLTGACGGLGSHLALKLCQENANVILTDKNPRSLNILCDKIVEHAGKEPFIYPMDLMGATPDDFLHLANTIDENIGNLDAVIHTAAEFSGLTEFCHYEPTRWLKELQINLNSPLFLTQALIPLLKDSKGSIIFTLDNLKTVSKAYWGAYGMCKGALEHMASILKQELENAQVDVHTITPKPMKTQLRSKAWPAEDGAHLLMPAEVVAQYLSILKN